MATPCLDLEAAGQPDEQRRTTCANNESAERGPSTLEPRKWRTWLNPTTLLVSAIACGAGLGAVLSSTGLRDSPAVAVLAFPGKLWLKSLKCIVLPMIILSLVNAMVTLRSLPGSKRLGLLVIVLYQLTTLVAAANGCLVSAAVLGPTLSPLSGQDGDSAAARPDIADRSLLETILGIFDNMIPTNLVGDAASGNLLPIILASIIFGLLMPDRQADAPEIPSATLQVVREWDQVVTKVVTFIMKLTPLGVGSLVLRSTASLNLAEVGGSLAMLIAAVALGIFIHMFLFYPLLLLTLARRNPVMYYRNCVPALATALGTSSSAAALPVTTTCSVEKNGVPGHIASFALSLGATINMDGTGIYLICATYFLAALQGIHFGLGKFMLTALLATLCSMGSAPVPSASLVLLATILAAVGVPLTDSFGLIMVVDWMLDRLRTTVNVAGDLCVVGVITSTLRKDEVQDTSTFVDIIAAASSNNERHDFCTPPKC